MNDDPLPASRRRKKRATRRLTWRSRTRQSIRRLVERTLSADRWWSLALVVLGLLLIGSTRCGGSYPQYELGDIATRDVTVESDVQIPDVVATEARRTEVASRVRDVWVHHERRGDRLAFALSELFARGRARLDDPTAPAPQVADARAARALASQRWSESLERELSALIRESMDNWILAGRRLVDSAQAIDLVHRPSGREERIDRARYDGFKTLDEVRAEVRRRAMRDLPIPQADRTPIAAWAADWIDVNVTFDDEETRIRRARAANVVEPVPQRLVRGTVILNEGDRVDEASLARLEAVRQASAGTLGLEELFSLLLLLGLLALFLFRYATYHQRGFHKLAHLHALLVGVLLGVLALSKALLWLASVITSNLRYPFDRLEVFYFLAPVAAGPIIVALLANGRIAMVYAAFASVLFGILCGNDFALFAWALLVQWAAVYAISTYRDRAALLRAGLVVGGAGAVLSLALAAVEGTLRPWPPTLAGAGLAFIGGAVGVGLVVSFTLPMLESVFGVLTDVRLLELSNSDHPLLKELAVRAPGTYNHSLVVGTLAEEAARAIGANALFCRVAAAYHDVGKMNKAEYYVENQSGENPHDKLSPSMSALIIAAHVKDGLTMAREAGLPRQIVDIIPQHHGTRLMKYFYEKAKGLADPSTDDVKESDFRYPGPKPQTREAAIFMMADGVEAAARTLDEPTPNRLREVIRQVTNAIVLEGQLEECDLTFTDLERIQKAFHRLLVSMYHQRVDYPGFDFGNRPRGERRPVETDRGDDASSTREAGGWTS